jgi:DNA-binding NarL/FixJ family response regulator
LVIDADAAMLTSVASVAAEEGFDVRTAADVDGAMRQCRSAYIDLVLIDARGDQRSAAKRPEFRSHVQAVGPRRGDGRAARPRPSAQSAGSTALRVVLHAAFLSTDSFIRIPW